MAKKGESKILNMDEYAAGLIGAAAGSKAANLLISSKQAKGGSLVGAAAGSSGMRKALKRKIGRAKGGSVKKGK